MQNLSDRLGHSDILKEQTEPSYVYACMDEYSSIYEHSTNNAYI